MAECCIGGPWAPVTLGAAINLSQHEPDVSDEGWLFGEDGARAVVSCGIRRTWRPCSNLAAAHGVPAHYLGLVGEGRRRRW